jgi:copper/silver efflux system protein
MSPYQRTLQMYSPFIAEEPSQNGEGCSFRVRGHRLSQIPCVLREQVKLPPGYAVLWSGQYEAMARVRARLTYIIPFTVLLVFLLLYLNTRSLAKTAIVLLAVPFSAVGAVWFLYLLGYNMSIAVWVGLIALLGVDAETGVFMLLYVDLAYEKASREGHLRTLADLQATIVEGAAKRLRPKFMTVATMFVGLIPIMWATGTGSDVWKRIAAPMVGGIFTSFALELIVYPAIYEIWKWHFEMKCIYAELSPTAPTALASPEAAPSR